MVKHMKSLATFGSGPFSTGDTEGRFGHYDYNDVPKLLAIFFAEFDIQQGPALRHQVPKDVVTREVFKSCSASIIPKPDLFNRSVKLNLADYKILGYPIGLEHGAYPRSTYICNMCFVVARDSTADSMYEPIVQKCAEYLVELEQECWFLTEDAPKANLPRIISQMYNDLSTNGESVIEVTEMTTMYFKLCPSYRGIEPPEVSTYMVPMFIREVELTSQLLEKMDVLSQKIIPMIDGIRTVCEIANDVSLDPDLVARCVRNLHFYECVSLVPMFLYSNTYVATERVHDFYLNESEIADCLGFVRLTENDCRQQGLPHKEPKFTDIFRLYLSMRVKLDTGTTIRDWVEEMSPRALGVDEVRLVQFGMHHQFLRKLTVYPICRAKNMRDRIYALCNGKTSLEELALKSNVLPSVLYKLLQETEMFEFIMK